MRLNGISLPHKKGTKDSATVAMPLPERVRISMSQHMGAPCSPLVKKGDLVKVGQKIGKSEAFMSCPVHSSVSGEVTDVGNLLLANGKTCKYVEIHTDGLQTMSEEVTPPVVTDKQSLVNAIRESGCCGLGGAGFPTHIKLNYDETKTDIDSLVINAAECEPYITSDYREMMENPDGVLEGIKLLQKILEIENVYIGIEDNKPKAIEMLEKKTKDDSSIKIVSLESSYPQGAEKVLAYSCTGRIITEGNLPSSHGIIVMNVSTVGFINSYIKTGVPLVERRVTVDGELVKKPCNVKVLVGTPVSEILKFAETDIDNIHKLISGGPMMGMCLYDIDAPLSKTNNAFLAMKKQEYKRGLLKTEQTNCIRCGRCISACPLGLMPAALEKAYDKRDKDTLNKLKIDMCINCGSCSYVCPAKRPLAEKNQLAKGFALSK